MTMIYESRSTTKALCCTRQRCTAPPLHAVPPAASNSLLKGFNFWRKSPFKKLRVPPAPTFPAPCKVPFVYNFSNWGYYTNVAKLFFLRFQKLFFVLLFISINCWSMLQDWRFLWSKSCRCVVTTEFSFALLSSLTQNISINLLFWFS